MTNAINVQELIENFRKRKIQLWAEAGKLKFKAPKGILNDDDIKVLKTNKSEILNYIESENKTVTILNDKENRYNPFPLTDVQEAYLLGRNPGFRCGGVSCHIYLEFDYDALDHLKVEEAWNRLIDRHEMLRAIVVNQEYQMILKEYPKLKVTYNNLADLTKQEQSKSLEKIRKKMSHRVYNTEKWPLFDIAVTDLKSNQLNSKKKSILHFSMEFLIADWISMSMLMNEFEQFYFTPKIKSSPLTLSFRDYVIAERGVKETPAYAKDRSYWMKRIDTLPQGPKLPLARREDTSTNHFTRNTTLIEIEKWNLFKEKAQTHSITPTAAISAVYAAVLERWSDNQHFCLNLTVLNRMPLHEEVAQIIGDFTTVSLLEVDWRKKDSFFHRAKQMNMLLFDDLDHTLFTGIEVLREMNKKSDENILLPVVLTSAIGLLGDENSNTKGVLGEYNISQTPQVYIDCQVIDTANGLTINWDTRDGIFPPKMIEDMFHAFRDLIYQLAEDVNFWQKEDLIGLPHRHQQERDQLNNNKVVFEKQCLHQPILKQIKNSPDKIAVIDNSGQITFGQLGAKALAISKELKKLGCVPQDTIAITLPKSYDQVAAVLSVLLLGGVYIPIDINQPVDRRSKIIGNADVKYVLTTKEILKQGYGVDDSIHIIAIDDLEQKNQEKIDSDLEIVNDDVNLPAYVIYTSGSTGEPKGVVISHESALNTIEDVNARFEVSDKDSVLALSQLGFDLSVYDIFGILGKGGKIIYPDSDRQNDPSHWFELIKKFKITLWNTAPALMQMFVNFLENEQTINDLSQLRLAFLSGDWIPLQLPDKLKFILPKLQLISMGGATEASIWSNFHIYKGLESDWNSIPYGRPFSNQGFRILDEQMHDCPEWKTGDLYITGKGLAIGYLNDSQKTNESFFLHPTDGDRLYKTGDLGRYTPGGEIEFLGRRDKQIKIRGHRIELGEIESVLTDHSSIANAVVIAKENQENNNNQSLFGFVTANNTKEIEDKKLINELQKNNKEIQRQAFQNYPELSDLDQQDTKKAIDSLEYVSCYSMLHVLQSLGTLKENVEYDQNSILSVDGIHEKFKWLVKIWLSQLVERKLVTKTKKDLYVAKISTNSETEQQQWQDTKKLWGKHFEAADFVDYSIEHIKILPQLLSGKVDAISLLFPAQSEDRSDSIYLENKVMQYLSAILARVTKEIFTNFANQKLRILEIGAGTGAASKEIIEQIKGEKFEYHYTDITPYFFEEAKIRYKELSNIHYRVYNMDKDYRQQGLKANSYDLVIAGGGVLIGAKDTYNVLHSIKELVRPGGFFICSEPTREHNWLLVTQAFMMNKPEDNLRLNQSCLNYQDWLQVLKDIGGGAVFSSPDNHIKEFGQHVLVTQMKSNKSYVSNDSLFSHLHDKLPEYMIPSSLEMIDKIPITNNGKVNLKKLESWCFQDMANDTTEQQFANELESEIAKICSDLLGIEKVLVNKNLNDYGTDSLMMAQIAGKIRDKFSGNDSELTFDLILRQLLSTPTIAELAKFLQDRNKNLQKNISSKFSEKIGIITRFGGEDEELKRIFIPGGNGNLDGYKDLLKHLVAENSGSVYGISVDNYERYSTIDSDNLIELTADDYVDLILEKGAEKVQMIGHSVGSAIAVEMARRLSEKGVEIVDIVIIDGIRVPFKVHDDIFVEFRFLDTIGITTKDIGFGEIDINSLKEWIVATLSKNKNEIPEGTIFEMSGNSKFIQNTNVFNKMKSMDQSTRFDQYLETMLELSNGQRQMPKELLERTYKIFAQNFRASKYTPAPYFGDIRHLKAKDQRKSKAFGINDDIEKLWKEISLGKVTNIEIEGDHLGCVGEEYAPNLAKLIAT